MNEQAETLEPLDQGPPEVEVIPAGSAEAAELEASEPEDGELAVLEGIPEEATNFDLWRRHHRTRKYEFVDNLALDDFSLGLVAERYGGGDYQLRPKRANGKLLTGARVFTIAGPPRIVRDPAPSPDGAPDQLGTLTELMRDIALELRARNEGAPSPAGENPMKLAMDMAREIRESTQAAVELAMASRNEAGGLDPFELLNNLLDLQDRLGGGGGGGGTDSIVRELGREVLTVFRDARGDKGPSHAGAAATSEGGAPPPSVDPNRPAWVKLLEPTVPTLIGLAAAGRDPDVYAVVILDQLPAQAVDMLGFVVAGPGFADTFYLHFPDTLAHREWFDALIASVRGYLTGEDDASDIETLPAEGPVSETETGPGAP